jgi:hypothetical protein
MGFAARLVAGYIYVPDTGTDLSGLAAGPPTLGVRSICPGRAGWNLIRRTELWATETSSASLWPEIPIKPFRCRACTGGPRR